MRILAWVVLALSLVGPAPVSAADADRLARASLAAAEANLRLHETANARKWLNEVPEPLRHWEWSYLSRLAEQSQAVVEAHGGPITDVSWSPDGSQVASASSDGTVKLWDARSRALRRSWSDHTGPVWSAAFSPDGRRLVSSSSDGSLRLRDVETGAEVWKAEGLGRAVQSIAFSPDGGRLAVAAKDGRVRVWDLAGRRVVHTLTGQAEGQARWIDDVAFTPDGSALLAAGQDSTLRRWKLDRGRTGSRRA